MTHCGEECDAINVNMKQILDKMKELELIDNSFTPQQLGYIRSNQLHIKVIQTTVDGNPKQIILWDDDKMEALKNRYIPEDEWENLGLKRKELQPVR